MTDIQKIIYNNILTIIKDNLKILICNNNSCLYRLNKYCNDLIDTKKTDNIYIDKNLLILFTEESLYALLNADFLYDCKWIS